jgi:hypothetical protein
VSQYSFHWHLTQDEEWGSQLEDYHVSQGEESSAKQKTLQCLVHENACLEEVVWHMAQEC